MPSLAAAFNGKLAIRPSDTRMNATVGAASA
jgi:hypothetical protein